MPWSGGPRKKAAIVFNLHPSWGSGFRKSTDAEGTVSSVRNKRPVQIVEKEEGEEE